MLDFVKEHVGCFAGRQPCVYVIVEFPIRRQVLVFKLFEVDGDDLVRRNAVLHKVIAVDLEELRLAAAAHARHDLDDMLVFPGKQPLKISIPSNKLHASRPLVADSRHISHLVIANIWIIVRKVRHFP